MKQSEHVLDLYGNNAAVRCPSCLRVYIVSKWVNRLHGRLCPGCGTSRAIFSEDAVSVTIERTEAGDVANDPLIRLIGSGKHIWADQHADEYVENLRKGHA